MKYKVVNKFADLQDGGRLYEVGETYPRKGYVPAKERIAELSSIDNKRGKPLIKEIKEKKSEKAEK